MFEKLDCQILKVGNENNSIIYGVGKENIYIVSNPDTRALLCDPEIVGYNLPQKLFAPIKDTLQFFSENCTFNNINLVNILRGGLNFPLEMACFYNEIEIDEISFLTSERIFLDDKVSRIESKYRKIANVPDAVIMIGDIIASGETFYNTVRYIVEKYVFDKNQIKKIIVFTIGTDNTLKVVHQLETELKKRWNTFEGIVTIFLEGIFTTYSSRGITKLNLPYVDFTFRDGVLAPEYRKSLLERPHIVFEKCAIYDGGARRFEKKIHINTIISYWNALCLMGNKINLQEFYQEKMGYYSDLTFPDLGDWIRFNHYEKCDEKKMASLYLIEKNFYYALEINNLLDIATERYRELIIYYHI